jgi:hypothetical protein
MKNAAAVELGRLGGIRSKGVPKVWTVEERARRRAWMVELNARKRNVRIDSEKASKQTS